MTLDMTLEIQAVARAIGAAGDPPPGTASGWSVDTRTQNAGDVYFALRGPNHDGHEFIAAAIEKRRIGASGGACLRRRLANSWSPTRLRALQQLGAWARRQWGGTVIGVTGSAGKTTTKDAIAHLLAAEMPVGKTVGNFNNHVGVPLSLLRLPDGCRAGVIEMGMNHAGEIRELAEIARPQIGVVTNVGYAHVEFFDSIEGIARAKRELIEGLTPGWRRRAERRRSARGAFRRCASRPLADLRPRRRRGHTRRKRELRTPMARASARSAWSSKPRSPAVMR